MEIEKKISDIEESLDQIKKVFTEHNKIFQNISEKLAQHDEMFVETINVGKNLANSTTKIFDANNTNDAKLTSAVDELMQGQTQLFRHITKIYNMLSEINNK